MFDCAVRENWSHKVLNKVETLQYAVSETTEIQTGIPSSSLAQEKLYLIQKMIEVDRLFKVNKQA